jgi:3-phosphoshikimate 1-carboxyvinyltransferase
MPIDEYSGGQRNGSYRVTSSKSVSGCIRVPGDKSISHRAVMMASLAMGTSEIHGFLPSSDCLGTLLAFSLMGVRTERSSENHVRISSPGAISLTEPQTVLDLGNSGTAVRLLLGILAGTNFHSVVTGDDSLRSRPMGRVTEPLSLMGASIDGVANGKRLPLAIRGRKLKAITFLNEKKSAQVKSSILLAGLSADGPTTVIEPVATRDHTELMLPMFGATCTVRGNEKTVHPGPLSPLDFTVPGDLSSAAFFMVLGLITPGASLTIEGVGLNPTRTAIIRILQLMGGKIQVTTMESQGEPVGTLHIQASSLEGIEVPEELIPQAIDEIPVLAVAAAFAKGRTIIKNASELRVKESDRITAICQALSSTGISVTELPDGLIVEGGGPAPKIHGAEIESHNDHRITMSMVVLGSRLPPGETLLIHGTDFVATSFPGFVELFNKTAGIQN